MTEIYLARHPETFHNEDRSIVSGRSNDVLVTPRGIEQAHRFAEVFDTQYPKPDILFSSPAFRTRFLVATYLGETGRDLPYFVDVDLQEMGQGVAEGKKRNDIYTAEVIERINTELFDFKLQDGESLNDVSNRMLEWAWRVHREFPDKTILAAGHGQAIRSFVGNLLGWTHYQTTLDPATMTPNVSLTHVTVTDEGIDVHFVGKEIIEPVEAA